MPSPKKSRSAKRARPKTDATCALARTVERDGRALRLWTCSAPDPVESDVPELLVEREVLVEKIGRRKWRFERVSAFDVGQGDPRLDKPGWYYAALHADPRWVNNEPNGPYATFDDAWSDAVITASSCD